MDQIMYHDGERIALVRIVGNPQTIHRSADMFFGGGGNIVETVETVEVEDLDGRIRRVVVKELRPLSWNLEWSPRKFAASAWEARQLASPDHDPSKWTAASWEAAKANAWPAHWPQEEQK